MFHIVFGHLFIVKKKSFAPRFITTDYFFVFFLFFFYISNHSREKKVVSANIIEI